ncbi:MAG: class I SAM-dependent methyltransferase [Terriglobales bacterium]
MRRYHLFEFNDQPWCPESIRNAALGLLGLVLNTGNHYGSIVPELRQGLEATRTGTIVDLCSGGGGPWKSLIRELERTGLRPEVVLTDLFPNLDAFSAAAANSTRIRFIPEPVDATAMPPTLTGFRTLFTSFHHFRPEMARAILADAVRNRAGIGIFEFTYRMGWPTFVLSVVPAAIGTILLVLLAMPFVRPFRWKAMLFTYLIPIIPLAAIWDGTVSCMRTYSPAEMLEMARSVSGDDEYEWSAGLKRTWSSFMPVSYLVGVPRAVEDPSNKNQ